QVWVFCMVVGLAIIFVGMALTLKICQAFSRGAVQLKGWWTPFLGAAVLLAVQLFVCALAALIVPKSDKNDLDLVRTLIGSLSGGTRYQYGYIDTNGRIMIQPQFDTATDFKNGVARVTTGSSNYSSKIGDYVFIDRTGKQVDAHNPNDYEDNYGLD